MSKFIDSLDTAVFTTKYVIEQNSPILYVYHYEDGSWQFNGKEINLTDDDYKVISLREMLTLDETLKELGDMPLGFEAVRKTKEDVWNILTAN